MASDRPKHERAPGGPASSVSDKPPASLPPASLPPASLPAGSPPPGSLPAGSIPAGSKPDPARPNGSRPVSGAPRGGNPDGGKPNGSKPDAAEAGSIKSDSTKAGNPQSPKAAKGNGQPQQPSAASAPAPTASTPAPHPAASPAAATGPTATGPSDPRQPTQPQPAAQPAAGNTASGAAASGNTASGAAGRPSAARQQLEELNRVGRLRFSTLAPAWLVSAVVHMVVLLVFGLIAMPAEVRDDLRDLLASRVVTPEQLEEIDKVVADQPVEISPENSQLASQVQSTANDASMGVTEVLEQPAPLAAVELSDIGIEMVPASDLLSEVGGVGDHALAGRGEGARKMLVAQRGGNDASEAAVAAALKWLAMHQNADGSWSFDHRGGRCQGRCGNPGTLKDARLAATGMALLPFLGAGQTHKQGKYKDQVRGGLYFLVNNMVLTTNGGDMTGGGGMMYGHGIATMALCEAFAMTQDKQLMAPAQQAINFIMYAQDPNGGGWRYTPRAIGGDTSVLGWQVMALKSGHLGFLQVHPLTIKNAYKFLDMVQIDGGADYGYTSPEVKITEATRAIGLLCRMHLGWKRENPAMERGVQALAALGPSQGDMYYNYYATQVMHHYEGELWNAWNSKMRDFLVNSQAKEGHEAGSWMLTGDHGSDAGGRLYSTSMAAMTLEVYYRHMPIYARQSAEADFEQ